MARFDKTHVLILSSVVIIDISCIVLEIKKDVGRKSRCFNTPFYVITSGKGKPLQIFSRYFFATESD